MAEKWRSSEVENLKSAEIVKGLLEVETEIEERRWLIYDCVALLDSPGFPLDFAGSWCTTFFVL